jgi:hypothetical protein
MRGQQKIIFEMHFGTYMCNKMQELTLIPASEASRFTALQRNALIRF